MNALAGHGLVICTYNRNARLNLLLRHLHTLTHLPAHLVIVFGDAGGADPALVLALEAAGIRTATLRTPPSTPLQRAEGVAALPEAVSVVHFIDDDFFPDPDYFMHLAHAFQEQPGLAGAGGIFSQPVPSFSHPKWRVAMGLDSTEPGRVLHSGFTTNGQANMFDRTIPFPVEWLSGCSMSFRRAKLEQVTFPSELEGYAMDEDLIISWQVSRLGPLQVIPQARGRHESQKDVRTDKPWFFYTLAARRHAVRYYLQPQANRFHFWCLVGVRLVWRAWRNKLRPLRWPAYWYNVWKLLTDTNAPKINTFRANLFA